MRHIPRPWLNVCENRSDFREKNWTTPSILGDLYIDASRIRTCALKEEQISNLSL